MMVDELTLYESVTTITEDYLGPAAPRFVSRLIVSHLHKDPQKLTKKDIAALSRWAKISLAMLTDDEAIVDEFIGRLRKLNSRGSWTGPL